MLNKVGHTEHDLLSNDRNYRLDIPGLAVESMRIHLERTTDSGIAVLCLPGLASRNKYAARLVLTCLGECNPKIILVIL